MAVVVPLSNRVRARHHECFPLVELERDAAERSSGSESLLDAARTNHTRDATPKQARSLDEGGLHIGVELPAHVEPVSDDFHLPREDRSL